MHSCTKDKEHPSKKTSETSSPAPPRGHHATYSSLHNLGKGPCSWHAARMPWPPELCQCIFLASHAPFYACTVTSMLINYQIMELAFEKESLAAIRFHTQSFPNFTRRKLFWLKSKGEKSKSQGFAFEAPTETKSKHRCILEISCRWHLRNP